MDNLTEQQRIEKLNAEVSLFKTGLAHFVQNCHVTGESWRIKSPVSHRLSQTTTTFEVKEVEDLEDNVCYVDSSSD